MSHRKAIAPDEEPARNPRVARSSINREVGISATDMTVEYEGKMHKILFRGIRDPKGRVKGYRVEIRPAGWTTKIWVGTFSTREKAKRAYDVALYTTGKDAYYYKYPQNYFPERKSPAKAQYVKEKAKEYAEKTEKFPVNPLCLMGHVSLLPGTDANLPCSPGDSPVTLHAAESPFEISKCGIDEPLTLSDESPESSSWRPFEMNQNATLPAAGYRYHYPDELWFPNNDCSFDENFMAQFPSIISPSTRSIEEYDFDKITNTLFGNDDNDERSTAIIDQGLIECQPQLNLFNPIEDGDYYLPYYPIQDQKRMRTMCDTNVEQLWKTESTPSNSIVDNLYISPSLFQW